MDKQEVDKLLKKIGDDIKENWKNGVKCENDTIEINILDFANEHIDNKSAKELCLANWIGCKPEDLTFIYENDKIKEVQYKEPMRKVVIEFPIDPKDKEVIQ